MALNPVIKFTTLFGLLAVELAVSLTNQGGGTIVAILAGLFFVVSAYFVWRSFYKMRIDTNTAQGEPPVQAEPAKAADAVVQA